MTGEDADFVQVAARNNAELCDLVCGAHGVTGVFSADAWTSTFRTPPFYPDAVTLDPAVDALGLLERIDGSQGASVKDSFATLDLGAHGFRVLFGAEWIFRAADAPAWSGLQCSRVSDAAALSRWEQAWSDGATPPGLFSPALLDSPDLVVLRCCDAGGRLVGGAILNRSRHAVGISNLFATGDPAGVWAGCLAEATARFPGFAIVGYEQGDHLDLARRAGFRSIGALRVWINDR
ncbi:MAG: hypothetical protein ACXVJW_00800 [Acidimicrobiia bacterium]